jgi:hypothetical protein
LIKKDHDSSSAHLAIEKSKTSEQDKPALAEPIVDSASNVIRRRQIESESLKSFRLTRDPRNSFSIDLGAGVTVADARPIKHSAESGDKSNFKVSSSEPQMSWTNTQNSVVKSESINEDKSPESSSFQIVREYLFKMSGGLDRKYSESGDRCGEKNASVKKLANHKDESSEKDLKHNTNDAAKEPKIHNMGVSKECLSSVHDGLSSIPDHEKARLKSHGVEIFVFKSIKEYDEFYGTHHVQEKESGTMASLCEGKPPRIAVFEKYLDGTSIEDGTRCNRQALVRHEIGHAISHLEGLPVAHDVQFQTTFKNEFLALSDEDKQRLRQEIGTKEHQGKLWRYFGGAEKEEVYEEMYAMATGGGSDPYIAERLKHYFPKTVDYMRHEYEK